MKEILSKLLESNVLNEETMSLLEGAITDAIAEARDTARREAIIEAQASVARQWEQERSTLIMAIDEQVTEGISASVAELTEAKKQLEDLKVDLSRRYIKREHELAENVKKELNNLITDLDVLMKQVVESYMPTVAEDIKAIKRDNFGRAIFKAFAQEFVNKQLGSDALKSITESAKINESKLNAALEENARLRAQLNESSRQVKMKELLAPLTGEKRKVMEALLANVPLTKLDESYRTYLSRVLKTSEKEKSQVLAEGKKTAAAPGVAPTPRRPARRGVTVTGDSQPLPTRSTPDQLDEGSDMTRHLQRMAGIAVK